MISVVDQQNNNMNAIDFFSKEGSNYGDSIMGYNDNYGNFA